jgi:hypothetical protein
MKTVKVLLMLGAVLGLIAAGIWQFYFKGQAAYAQIAAAYTAKQVCSCRFIAKRELQSCLGDFTNDISALTITQQDKSITSKAPLGLAKARALYSPALGCALSK